jgi:hypothetical protein
VIRSQRQTTDGGDQSYDGENISRPSSTGAHAQRTAAVTAVERVRDSANVDGTWELRRRNFSCKI